MHQVKTSAHHTILDKTEGPAAQVFNAQGKAPICFVCEHASAMIPARLGHLGLSVEHRKSHAAWDIGAFELAQRLSESLDAPLVASRVSRLVYDCNRPPSAGDAMPSQSETIPVPGNLNISATERAQRVHEVYEPFKNLLSATLNNSAVPPALITIHSFTPSWYGTPRDVQLGLLHDADDRLAKTFLTAAPDELVTQLNAPYGAGDGVTHTLREHALPRGLHNVMIELRNDLVSDAHGVARIAALLEPMLAQALAPQGIS